MYKLVEGQLEMYEDALKSVVDASPRVALDAMYKVMDKRSKRDSMMLLADG